jgi:hypothetical protein
MLTDCLSDCLWWWCAVKPAVVNNQTLRKNYDLCDCIVPKFQNFKIFKLLLARLLGSTWEFPALYAVPNDPLTALPTHHYFCGQHRAVFQEAAPPCARVCRQTVSHRHCHDSCHGAAVLLPLLLVLSPACSHHSRMCLRASRGRLSRCGHVGTSRTLCTNAPDASTMRQDHRTHLARANVQRTVAK